MKASLTILWRLFQGLLFYPVMIGIFIWLYITDKHWFFGLLVIAAILILDPIWRIIGRRALEILGAGKRPNK